jgi:hypothetical protein
MRSAIKVSLGVAATCSAAALAIPLATAGGGMHEVSPSTSGAAAASGGEPAIQLFRRPAAVTDVLSRDLREGPLLEGGVVDGGTVRRVQVAGTRAVYVARGRQPGTLCLVASGGLGCGDTAALRNEGLMWGSSWREGEPNRVEGLVVDSVTEVALELEDGSRLLTVPRENTFSFATEGRPRELRWEFADGGTGSAPVTVGGGRR